MNAEENRAKLCYLLWDYFFLLPPHPITHSLLHDYLLKIKPGFFSRNICVLKLHTKLYTLKWLKWGSIWDLALQHVVSLTQINSYKNSQKEKKKVKMVNFMLYILSHLKKNKTKQKALYTSTSSNKPKNRKELQ